MPRFPGGMPPRVPVLRSPATAPRGVRLLPTLTLLALAVSVVVRLHTRSALWLDEALSVHIARLPLGELQGALREDGSPPLYYVLLHGWIAAFGQAPTAVRALSTVFALAALPLLWLLAARLTDRTTAWVAVLLLGSSPFAVRYATETRMYSLVLLEAVLLGLALQAARTRPTLLRLGAVSATSAALALTHYWALFLLAVVAAVLLQQRHHRLLLAEAAGGVLVLPWLPTLLFQVQHTGTPWAPQASWADALRTLDAWAGPGTGPALLLSRLLLVAVLLGVLAERVGGQVVLRRPRLGVPVLLLAAAAGTLLLGLTAGVVLHAGYAVRYSAPALAPALLLAAVGLRSLPVWVAAALTALAVVCGLGTAVHEPTSTSRTQAAQVAEVLREGLAPDDLVVYCPDQLGPAVADLLPAGTRQAVYPTLAGPDRVDWVDYAQRNRAADPAQVQQDVLARAGSHTVWLVTAPHYRTFGKDCEQLAAGLAAARPGSTKALARSGRFAEQADVLRYPSP
jgi:mannosyltransferase